MKKILLLTLLVLPLIAHGEPLRVFIRGGVKTHGPNAHEHERFLKDWTILLKDRGMKSRGAMGWPNAQQLAETDVLVMYAQDGGNATAEQKENLAKFTQRGGGIVVIHTAAVSDDSAWWKSVIGGAWVPGKTKWREGPMELNFSKLKNDAPGITEGAVDFKMDDEIYYNLDMSPEVRVLATSDTGDGEPKVQAQMWTFEKDNYRAFVCLPGHLYSTFERPNCRAILMRGIAWAGKIKNLDTFCKAEEIQALGKPAN
ncbi:MAG: ThuA domain-containing protein [Verrucomicrobiota bacterium]